MTFSLTSDTQKSIHAPVDRPILHRRKAKGFEVHDVRGPAILLGELPNQIGSKSLAAEC